jgi:hypothetical protein
MTDDQSTDSSKNANADFAREAGEQSPGIVREFVQFLGENKKWWLIPILVAVGLIALLVALSASPLAPLIYPIF